MTVIVRAKPRDRNKPESLTEHMIRWPSDDAVSAWREHGRCEWTFTTTGDILRAKRERMERSLYWKRESGVVRRRAVCVWSFWCPGIAGFAFCGWWMYLKGVGGETIHAGGVKGDLSGDLLERVRELFPVPGQLGLFGPPHDEDYAEAFARRYQRGTHCGKPQGMAKCWARMRGGYVLALELDA